MANKKKVFSVSDLERASNNTDSLWDQYSDTVGTLEREKFSRGLALGMAMTEEVNILMLLKKATKGDAEIMVARRLTKTGHKIGPSTVRMWTDFVKKDKLAKIKKAKADTIDKARLAVMTPEARSKKKARDAAKRKHEMLTTAQRKKAKSIEDKAKAEAKAVAIEKGVTDPEDLQDIADNAEVDPADIGNLLADNALDSIDELPRAHQAIAIEAMIFKLTAELNDRRSNAKTA